MALIKVVNLEKTYRSESAETPALQGVSFDIEPGEFVAIMGPSGSGKSTLLHVLGFLDKPTKGEYLFEGKSFHDYSQDETARLRNKKMGFVFQSFNLLPRTSVANNVKLPLLYSGLKESLWAETALKVIGKVGLEHRANYEPSQLSGGEQQRAAIARALVNSPQVIFADEPTGNLDSKSGGQIMELLEQLHSEGNTIVLITHETYTAEYAERVIKLKDGLMESDEKVSKRRNTESQFIK